jgi:hypothetical protein
MTSGKKSLLLIASGAILATVPFAARLWRKTQAVATYACVASIHAALLDKRGRALPIKAGPEWKFLSEPQATRMISPASLIHPLDCRGWREGEPVTDYWGNHVQIAVRRPATEAEIEYVVWTNGPDGVSGTSDDCISPLGHSFWGRRYYSTIGSSF